MGTKPLRSGSDLIISLQKQAKAAVAESPVYDTHPRLFFLITFYSQASTLLPSLVRACVCLETCRASSFTPVCPASGKAIKRASVQHSQLLAASQSSQFCMFSIFVDNSVTATQHQTLPKLVLPNHHLIPMMFYLYIYTLMYKHNHTLL